MKIIKDTRFDLNDFHARWKSARVAAIKACINFNFDKKNKNEDEIELLKKVPSNLYDMLLKNVFDYSRKFALSASRYFKVSFELADFVDVLSGTWIPCFKDKWKFHNQLAYVLERQGCEEVSSLGHLICDYWREALDGLVMGLGENERFARHRSVGHGDEQCLDILYFENYSKPKVLSEVNEQKQNKKFGSIPSNIENQLVDVTKRFELMQFKVQWKGYSEGVLYYELKSLKGDMLCGSQGKLVHDSLWKEVSSRCPDIKLKDVSPLAVFGEGK